MGRQSISKHELAVFRRARGLTQGELAKLLGVSFRTVQAIELGHMGFPERQRLKIASLEGKDLIPVIEGRVTAYRQRLYKTAGLAAPAA